MITREFEDLVDEKILEAVRKGEFPTEMKISLETSTNGYSTSAIPMTAASVVAGETDTVIV